MKIIIPAIDIIDSRIVRLYQGDFSKVTFYDISPIEMAKRFKDAGAGRIHIVDLEGAKQGEPINIRTIDAIKTAVDIEIEVGGGIRTYEDIRAYKNIGLDYLVFSSNAFRLNFIEQARQIFGDNIIVSIDVKEGVVMVNGWQASSDFNIIDALKFLAESGISNIIYTEIAYDGTMQKRSLENLKKYNEYFEKFDIIISGGISDYDVIREALQFSFVRGVIIGRAIYDGKIDVKEAILRFQES